MYGLTLNASVPDEVCNLFIIFNLWFINALAYPVMFFCSLTCSKLLVLKVQILVNFSYESFFANFFLIQFAVLYLCIENAQMIRSSCACLHLNLHLQFVCFVDMDSAVTHSFYSLVLLDSVQLC